MTWNLRAVSECLPGIGSRMLNLGPFSAWTWTARGPPSHVILVTGWPGTVCLTVKFCLLSPPFFASRLPAIRRLSIQFTNHPRRQPQQLSPNQILTTSSTCLANNTKLPTPGRSRPLVVLVDATLAPRTPAASCTTPAATARKAYHSKRARPSVAKSAAPAFSTSSVPRGETPVSRRTGLSADKFQNGSIRGAVALTRLRKRYSAEAMTDTQRLCGG